MHIGVPMRRSFSAFKRNLRLALAHGLGFLGGAVQHHGGGAVADAHAVDAHVDELQEVLAGADAAGALDLAAALGGVHHGLDDLVGGALVLAAGEEAGAGLHKVSARGDGGLGGLLHLVQSQGVGLEDDLHFGAVLVAHVAHGLDVGLHLGPHAAADPAVVGCEGSHRMRI